MSAPIVPPRPAASRQAPPPEIDLPQQPPVPPRPAAKQRGVSPGGRTFVQSPFNEKYDPLQSTKSTSRDPIRRPPSVAAMPGLGSEGYEYGEIQYQPNEPASTLAADGVAQTRSVAEDLKLHAPKPSLPTTSATAQVQAVTRTDSTVAAAHGIGRPPSQEGEPYARVRSRASFSRPDSAASGDRRRSIYEEGPADQGGFRVPINPLLGDVQAPSPAPGLSPHHTGGSPNESRSKRHSTTGRDSNPPGAYGLHGHGVQPTNHFEKNWYAKHPSELEHEEVAGHGVYESIGSGRGAFALSSDDLNKIVRNTASRGAGFGTSGNVVSYPDEQIGYMASEQYSSKENSHKPPTSVPESPLRKSSLPTSDAQPPELPRDAVSLDRTSSNEPEDVHIDSPDKKYNKLTGGEESMREREDVKPYATHPTEEDGLVDEHGYSVPILAEDEVAKEVGNEHLQPAISPAPRRGSGYDDKYRSDSSPYGSRPSSRPGSIHGLHSANLQRYISHHDDRDHVHTPLEDVDEYEPLFPDDDGKKAVTTAERFKQRPDALRQRFPSQDIWEDTPESAMYSAEVTTPDLPATEKRTSAFELPEAEHARKGEVSEQERQKLIPGEERLLKSKFAPHLRDDMPTRPGLQPRFPSQDIWEDTPDSQHLVATVNSPQEEEPVVPQRPEKSRLGEGASSQQIEPSVAPTIPVRPQKKTQAEPVPQPAQSELKKVPSIPDRPKPQIPARPAKKDPEELTKTISGGSQESTETVTSPPMTKVKPQVPARPAGSKIANLRSNFMNDLNQKLGMGPPKEKEKEPEPEPEEAKPLEDARKSRARGPQRRAPPKSANAPSKPSPLSFSISAPQSLWSIDDTGSLSIAKAKLSEDKLAQMENSTPADAPMAPVVDTTSKTDALTASTTDTTDKDGLKAEEIMDDAPRPMASALSTNTAGEHTDPAPVGDSPTSTKSATDNELTRERTTDSSDVPVSKQTTASDNSGATLELIESIEPAIRSQKAAKAAAPAVE